MTDVKRQILQAQLAEIDLRRSQLEVMLDAMPYSPNCCDDCERQELEDELRALWAMRSSLTKLRP